MWFPFPTPACEPASDPGRRHAFTLVELLVATTVFTLVLAMTFSVIVQTSGIWMRSSQDVDAFQSSRRAFDLLTRHLSQATLNTFLDYDDVTHPTRYLRKSSLAFVSGPAGTGGLPGRAGTGQAVFFQLPRGFTALPDTYGGMESLLNACGYFVDFRQNTAVPSHAIASDNPWRFRLMQQLVPSEENDIYTDPTANDWITGHPEFVYPVAENVIALVLRPMDTTGSQKDLTTDYRYDSRDGAADNPQPPTANQLPPLVHVTLIAIDDISAKRLDNGATPPAAITGALSGRFENPSQYNNDLAAVEDALIDNRIHYRVFSGAVPLRESKWTK